LHAVHSQLLDSNIVKLAISADGDEKLFPLVLGLVKTHPKQTLLEKGWKIHSFKQRQVPDPQEELTVGSVKLKFSDVECVVHRSKSYNNKVNISFRVKEGKLKPTIHIQNMVLILLLDVIGEYDTATKLDKVFFVDEFDEEDKPGVFLITQLASIIDEYTT